MPFLDLFGENDCLGLTDRNPRWQGGPMMVTSVADVVLDERRQDAVITSCGGKEGCGSQMMTELHQKLGFNYMVKVKLC